MLETIRTLVEAFGPSGYEEQTREIILAEIDGLADEVSVDAMGNVIAWKRCGKKDATRVMLSAHMDEIGVMVTHVDAKGFLRFTGIGGLNPHALLGNYVRFADGTIGTIGVEQKDFSASKAPDMNKMFIDVSGAAADIKVGDVGGFYRQLIVRGDKLVCKTMDDRIACAILIAIMRELKRPAVDVAFVFSTQEEVGLRGAETAAYAVDPAIGIALDVTRAGDTPEDIVMEVALGKGPAIKIKDGRFLASEFVIDLMDAAAKRAKIATQREVLIAGTTDAAAMQLVRAGVRAGCLSIPCRHIHTVSETVDFNDVQDSVKLMVELLSQEITV